MKRFLITLTLLTVVSSSLASQKSFCEQTQDFIDKARKYETQRQRYNIRSIEPSAELAVIDVILHGYSDFRVEPEIKQQYIDSDDRDFTACAIAQENLELQKVVKTYVRSALNRGYTKDELQERISGLKKEIDRLEDALYSY